MVSQPEINEIAYPLIRQLVDRLDWCYTNLVIITTRNTYINHLTRQYLRNPWFTKLVREITRLINKSGLLGKAVLMCIPLNSILIWPFSASLATYIYDKLYHLLDLVLMRKIVTLNFTQWIGKLVGTGMNETNT